MSTPTDGPSRADRRRATRRLWRYLVVAACVAAVLAPVGWLVGRPAQDAGLPIAEALSSGDDDTATAEAVPQDPRPSVAQPSAAAESVPSAPSPFGDVTARDASVDAGTIEQDPAPTRFQVAALGIDAAVDAVGVEDDGSMVIPAEIDRVGWYRFGPAAGVDRGNVVLAGHVDAAGEGPGALFELRGVEVGALITVTDAAGAAHEYEVVGRETVTKDVLPVDQIFDREGEHRLVVITCGGPFQPELRSYRDNVVVTAVPVGQA